MGELSFEPRQQAPLQGSRGASVLPRVPLLTSEEETGRSHQPHVIDEETEAERESTLCPVPKVSDREPSACAHLPCSVSDFKRPLLGWLESTLLLLIAVHVW